MAGKRRDYPGETAALRFCTKCSKLRSKKLSFNRLKRGHGGLSPWCKKCHKKFQDRWLAENKERVREVRRLDYRARRDVHREKHYKYKYGITFTEKSALFAGQGRMCASCGSKDSGSKQNTGESAWMLDHDHVTGKIRGVICLPCNVICGFAKDSPEHLRKIAIYLERALLVEGEIS